MKSSKKVLQECTPSVSIYKLQLKSVNVSVQVSKVIFGNVPPKSSELFEMVQEKHNTSNDPSRQEIVGYLISEV